MPKYGRNCKRVGEMICSFDLVENNAGSQITDEEVRGAEEKFAESLQLAQVGMYNLLENDVSCVAAGL